MEKTNRYNMEGIVLEIPLRWDEYSQKLVEDYSDFIKHPVRTPAGHPIFLTIEDACPYADMVDDAPANIDCGSCRHYHQFPGSLLGVCDHEKRRKKKRGSCGSGLTPANKEETLCEND